MPKPKQKGKNPISPSPSKLPHPQSSSEKKYCTTCGRLISPSHRNFLERKYCSKQCSYPRNKVDDFDREIESCFVRMAGEMGRRKDGVGCGVVEEVMRVRLEEEEEVVGGGQSERESSADGEVGIEEKDEDEDDGEEGGVALPRSGEVQQQRKETGVRSADSESTAQRKGMEKAQFRERVRRAGRRVVVFGYADGDGAGDGEVKRFLCIQRGKAVEPSFAKGEWAVRAIESSGTS